MIWNYHEFVKSQCLKILEYKLFLLMDVPHFAPNYQNFVGGKKHHYNNKPLALVISHSHSCAFCRYLVAWLVPALGLYEFY